MEKDPFHSPPIPFVVSQYVRGLPSQGQDSDSNLLTPALSLSFPDFITFLLSLTSPPLCLAALLPHQIVAVWDAIHVCAVDWPGAATTTTTTTDTTPRCSWLTLSTPSSASASPAFVLHIQLPRPGIHTLALYSARHAQLELLAGCPLTFNATGTGQPSPLFAEQPAKARPFRVGVYWTPYFTRVAQAAINASRQAGQPAFTVESVLRSNGTLPLASIPGFPNMFQHRPQLGSAENGGFYCVYKKRPGEIGIVPDCDDATVTTQRQAQLMASIGIDFMLFDHTNFNRFYGCGGGNCTEVAPGVNSCDADLLQLRPSEVLAEGWAALRAQGQQTPDIGSYNGVRAHEDLWVEILERLYNAYPNMTLRQQDTGKMVYVIGMANTQTTNWTAVNLIEQNGGRNNVVAVKMDYPDDPESLFYLNACNTPQGATTVILPQRPCNSTFVPVTPLGSHRVIQAEAALNSFPLGSPGRLHGLTMRKLFEDNFAQPADLLFLPSWNEFTVSGSPFAKWNLPTGPSQYFHTDGLEHDPNNTLLFIDGWGLGKSRSLEPSADDNGTTYQLLASCLRVARLERVAAWRRGQCSVSGEVCCQLTALQNVTKVWSLTRVRGAADEIVSTSEEEVQQLTASGQYMQRCNPFGTVSGAGPGGDFCVNDSMPYTPYPPGPRGDFAVRQGPFVAWAIRGMDSDVEIYRCRDAGGRHFLAINMACEGLGQLDRSLFYARGGRDSLAQRSLRRCRVMDSQGGTIVFYHSLDGPCFAGDQDSGPLGYVV